MPDNSLTRAEIAAMKTMRFGAVPIGTIRPAVRAALVARGLAAYRDHGAAWARRNPGYVRRVFDLTASGQQALRWMDAAEGGLAR